MSHRISILVVAAATSFSTAARATQQAGQLLEIPSAQQLALPQQVTHQEGEYMPSLSCVTAYAPPSRGGGQSAPIDRQAIDPVRDFAGLAPLGLRSLDLAPEEYAAAIEERTEQAPDVLDLVEVSYEVMGQQTCFVFVTAEAELATALEQSDLRELQYGVMVDHDQDGTSDVLLLTTPYFSRGVVTDSELQEISSGELWWDSSTLTLCGESSDLGEEPAWLAFTAQVSPGQQLPEVVPEVELLPMLDIASPLQVGTLTVSQSFQQQQVGQQTGQSGQATRFFTCPTYSGRAQVNIPGGGGSGELLKRKQCGRRGYDLWCIDASAFGTRVFDAPFVDGWVGRCPYACGVNVIFDLDVDGDGYPDELHHNVTDAPCSGGSSGTVPEAMLRTYYWPVVSGPADGETLTCKRQSAAVGSAAPVDCVHRVGPYGTFGNVPHPSDLP